LRQHQVGEIGFADFGKDLVGVHVGSFVKGVGVNVQRILKSRTGPQHQAVSVA
jgi:hypothetical protein